MSEIAQEIQRRYSDALYAGFPTVEVPTLALPDLTGAAVALTAVAISERYQHVLLVAPDLQVIEDAQSDLRTLEVPVNTFLESNSDDPEVERERLQVLRTFQHESSSLTLATLSSLIAPVVDPSALQSATLQLAIGSNLLEPAERLIAIGYERSPEVSAPKQFAIRGGIIDVWQLDAPTPTRLELFGDEIDSIRTFDPVTQRSIATVASVQIPPCDLTALPVRTLDQLIPLHTAIIWLDYPNSYELLARLRLENRKLPTWNSLRKRLQQRAPAIEIFCGDQPPPHTPFAHFELAPFPGMGRGEDFHATPEIVTLHRRTALEALANQKSPAFVCVDTDAMATLLATEAPNHSNITFAKLPLSGGFITPAFALAAQSDLTITSPRHRRIATYTHGAPIDQIAELEPGELVVHLNHGIGRFIGTTEINIAGERLEVFTLEYAEEKVLHVPVSQIHLLSKYVGVSGKKAKLHKLDGKRWLREKAEAQHSVEDLAAALLETQARRDVLQGFAFETSPPWLEEFESSFPYTLTPDQVKVIDDIKADMAKSRPMDRLICGDAGYGKTEVAMRAAFIAVMNHKQVAVLVPTTVLAEQHYHTFIARMGGFPIRIGVVSRLSATAERLETLRAAAEGQLDILIGTHALLQEQVSFKDLGLLVIDEEQRFGVAHKERLKRLRGLVDVLTLSATPIPRTLYLGMTGARDMSLLRTPPANRQPIETRIIRDSDMVLQSAIRQELHRQGQVYFLYNRVRTIPLIAKRIQRLVPEAKLGIVHGQMTSDELSEQMGAFARGDTNVLICTTLVENGLDIPRANTIIVHRADRFGIADLYQLRGRVGRSGVKARAWFLLPENGMMDSDARERIRALKRHAGLGTGFNLAMRDLEIRGAGNLLGTAQSGHIASIGFGLYCQLLKQTVARLKGEKPPLLVDVTLNLDFVDLSPGLFDTDRSACLPYDYVDEDVHRTGIHRRLAEATDLQELKLLAEELADRYGRLPVAAENLIAMTKLRILAAQRGVDRIEVKNGIVKLYDSTTSNPIKINHAYPRVEGIDAATTLRRLNRFLVKHLPRR